MKSSVVGNSCLDIQPTVWAVEEILELLIQWVEDDCQRQNTVNGNQYVARLLNPNRLKRVL